MKINIFKIKIKKKFGKENFKPSPNFYWKIILWVMFLMILASFAFGLYLFMKINKETASLETNIGGQGDIIREERIDKVLEYFSEREKESIKVLNSVSPIIDPSL